MGYDLHITRQQDWSDEDRTKNISMQEWLDFLATDPDMRLDNYAEAKTTQGDLLRVESDGLSVWTKYSGNGLNGNYAWFSYSSGAIVCKNPDDEIIHKMLDIAAVFNAKVQGDEGEIYELTPGNTITNKHIDIDNEKGAVSYVANAKPWWKFW